MAKSIRREFPCIALDAVNSLSEATICMQNKKYKVIVWSEDVLNEEMISLLKKRLPETLLIAITGNTDLTMDEITDEVRQGCVQLVLYKPLQLAELFSAIDNVLQRARALRSP